MQKKVRPETKWMPTAESDSLDELAKIVISGIVEEIKFRSSSSS